MGHSVEERLRWLAAVDASAAQVGLAEDELAYARRLMERTAVDALEHGVTPHQIEDSCGISPERLEELVQQHR